MVTGLVVNPITGVPADQTVPRIKRSRRYKFKSLLHNAFMDVRHGKVPKLNYRKANGFISFANMINPTEAAEWKEKLNVIKDFEAVLRKDN
jgi:hypothetical protein